MEYASNRENSLCSRCILECGAHRAFRDVSGKFAAAAAGAHSPCTAERGRERHTAGLGAEKGAKLCPSRAHPAYVDLRFIYMYITVCRHIRRTQSRARGRTIRNS